jgi:uncharacterized protein YndB with AHSA1/START domain
MSTTTSLLATDQLTLLIEETIRVHAPRATTFAALLEQLGPANQRPDGEAMPLRLEPWPGGRWFRDLGENNGHYWGTVQAIKRPELIEICGPLFMSYPVANNVQYRLREERGVTTIEFRHSGFGLIQEPHRTGVVKGWGYINDQARQRAEKQARS